VTKISEIPSLIEKAVKLHGHLGPFLVIGVRMGEVAKSNVVFDDKNSPRLRASIKTPPFTPFSCVIDGIQASTSCTVGNQRLRIENSAKEITATFRLEDTNRAVKILVNPKVVEDLINEMSKGADAEQLAQKIANMQAEQLFVLEE
jgi:formylmethanofuran dehydrogenase subunit E